MNAGYSENLPLPPFVKAGQHSSLFHSEERRDFIISPYSEAVSRRALDNNKGFTLLELIIVMFLIGLTLSLAAVLFSNTLPSSKFSSTARELAASVRHARTLAQLKGEMQTLTIDIDSRKYGIDSVTSKDIPPGVFIKVVDPLQGDIQTGKYQFSFPPIGGAEGGTIVLWNSKKTVRIEIDPIVGSAMVK